MSEQSVWTPCSNEERQRIECQTRTETHTRFGYWSLYRYASTVEIAGMRRRRGDASHDGSYAGTPQQLKSSCAKQKQIVFGNLSSSFVGMESQSFVSAEYQHLLHRYTLYFVYLGRLQSPLNPCRQGKE